ncbi:2-polyprenyl-6-methoxyphenol hydroxylase [Aureobasidium subglaciale]|nr:2-polyprenyl-6-methoxyphenol hydroxylase [Aureobasidium subglaciale]
MDKTIETDVIICGSGSAGICTAIWLAQAGISFRILERRPNALEIGQADGVAVRTVEIFESLGISEELLREAYHVTELTFWSTGQDGKIKRTGRAEDTPKGLSHCPHVILNQARVNGLLLDKMLSYKADQEIDYGHEVTAVVVSPSGERPVEVHAEYNGQKKIFRAKYAVGCDGAHSSVRRSLGYTMVGDSSNAVWGVMDIFPRTNFPDIRKKATIHTDAGSIVIIPREGGYMVRFYVQMPTGTDAKQVGLDDLQRRARGIFKGYEMEFAHTYWWSAYSIGQRLANEFSASDRVFLAGDACHTHSPKAGQGMNVSLQDGYNIGWKLAQVLRGTVKPEVITTYVSERRKVAADLIDFDRSLNALYATSKTKDDEAENARTFQEHFLRSAKYMAGLMTSYEDSLLVDVRNSDQDSAVGITPGMRFPSVQVVRLSDATALQLSKVLTSDGRWRILVFIGDIQTQDGKDRLQSAADYLSSEQSPLTRYSSSNSDSICLIDLILVIAEHRVKIEMHRDIPPLFYPPTGPYGLIDINKIFVDDESYNHDHGYAYETLGIDKSTGSVAVVRPDQCMSLSPKYPFGPSRY